jgi:hypothetical protein
MRDISGDLKERADILKGQIDGTEARFQVVITELQKERATQRQRLETELQAIHRLINLMGMQQALHRGLKSAVAALDALSAAKKSGTEGKRDNGKTPDSQSASQEVPHEVASSADQKVPVAQQLGLGHWLLDGRSAYSTSAHPTACYRLRRITRPGSLMGATTTNAKLLAQRSAQMYGVGRAGRGA